MEKLLLANLAAFAMMLAGPAMAADLPLKAEVPFVARFSWTGCYLGGSLGGAFAHKDITDPAQLVQDSFLGAGNTVGVTTVNTTPHGVLIGGQIGCDYQFAPSWVVGIEGAASGSTMKGSTNVALPLGNPDTALVQAKTDFLTSVTARIGYAFDNLLLYARGGAAMAADRYDVTGSFAGTPFGFTGLENRFGWTAGGGLEWAFTQHWSANFEYDYYQFGHRTVTMTDPTNVLLGSVDVRQNIQVVKVGLNFHIGANGW
ncbi:outer membrane protein [Bradyrhizobium betae]|uniref:Porin family protein n=1 Tax=Bradyrhizobium betae TaxID=244734 RepID=A0A5P6PB46_9BRAD|nr:outer membrane beta-barrel protein [Bradyrhizobium betae]MCS3726961.1 opacity protein-like surface antigen [Bradyrhizobium betae]QFI75104.1 porin family protein [Bradyrhizobium betae]